MQIWRQTDVLEFGASVQSIPEIYVNAFLSQDQVVFKGSTIKKMQFIKGFI